MRIISLCVEGIHQAAQKGLYDWLDSQDADIICLQDLRALEYELDDDIFHPQGYNAYFFDSGVKNYNGVAIYSRLLPKALIYGLGFKSGVDMEGRYLQVDFESVSIGSLLAPSATNDAVSQDIKVKFFDEFQAHLDKITRKRRDFIFCGNWQIAPKNIDVSNDKVQQHQSGFLPIEQQWMQQLFGEIGYSDACRLGNDDKDEYSWWPSGEIGKGDAWRTDLQVISAKLKHQIEYALIYKNQLFSSHLPVIVDYDLELQKDP
jgi:exodeoxyribonuclease III